MQYYFHMWCIAEGIAGYESPLTPSALAPTPLPPPTSVNFFKILQNQNFKTNFGTK